MKKLLRISLFFLFGLMLFSSNGCALITRDAYNRDLSDIYKEIAAIHEELKKMETQLDNLTTRVVKLENYGKQLEDQGLIQPEPSDTNN